MKRFYVCLFVLLSLFAGILAADTANTAKRKVIIGGDFNYPPYEYINDQNLPDGYCVELSRAICRQLNWEPEFRLAKWALVRSWLDNGNIDLIQGMAFSVERAQVMTLSESHAQTWRSIFVRRNSALKIPQDIQKSTVVIQQGDIAVEYLKRINFQGIVVEVPSQEDALELLDSGEYDAAVVNHMHGMYIKQRNQLKHIKALPQHIQQKEYCYAAKDPQLIAQVNNAMLLLSKNGQLDLIHDKWFGKIEREAEKDWFSPARLRYVVVPQLGFALLLILVMLYFVLSLRKKSRLLKAELDQKHNLEKELSREYSIFVRGPVIIYKMQAEPLKPLMISENIDQWGYAVEEILAMQEGFSELVFSEDRERFLEQMQRNSGQDYNVRHFRVLTKSGEIRWVLDYSTMVESKRYKQLYYGYLLDITSQKNLEAQLMEAKEKAESASLAKTHFLATMSHEIRTPLNGIMGFIQVLMQMDASPEQKEFYEIMYSSGRSLMKIINDILDFSKIESGKLELIISDFNPRFLIGDILKAFVIQNKKPGLEIRNKISEHVPNVLHGDQLRLKQVIINLLQNAIKFTDNGFVEISAEIYTNSENDVRLLFCVSDTGIGINPRKQQDIFDNFSQGDPLITSKYGGTGLGLSIVKRLVELMNGFIWVESEPGKGSSFFFILPFAKKLEAPVLVTEQATHPEIKLQVIPGMQVLLVEDEPINQAVTKRQLESWGIKVSIAANGQEALDLCERYRYNAILMDVQLPVMDGITATQTLRLREISLGIHTPIIAFTAAALVGDRERFLECGMDDYIAKPIEMNQLYSILTKYAPS